MREQAPGFAPAWEQAMRAATADLEASESGFTKLLRKVLPSSPASGRVEESETISLMPSASKPPNADG
jgi:Rod binding domain-containing protein